MRRLKWLGDERILPGIAHVVPGTEFVCDSDAAAQSYIDQGLAEEVGIYVTASEPYGITAQEE